MVTLNMTFIIITAVVVLFIVPTAIILSCKNIQAFRIIMWIFAILFIICLLAFVLLYVEIYKSYVTIEFRLEGGWFSKNIELNLKKSKIDILVNTLMLMPLGAPLMALFYKKGVKLKLLWATIIGLGIGVFIEFCQFMLPIPRTVQVTDALLNMISLFIGAVYFGLFMRLRKKIYKEK